MRVLPNRLQPTFAISAEGDTCASRPEPFARTMRSLPPRPPEAAPPRAPKVIVPPAFTAPAVTRLPVRSTRKLVGEPVVPISRRLAAGLVAAPVMRKPTVSSSTGTTCNCAAGETVPIPTCPVAVTVRRSSPPVATVSAPLAMIRGVRIQSSTRTVSNSGSRVRVPFTPGIVTVMLLPAPVAITPSPTKLSRASDSVNWSPSSSTATLLPPPPPPPPPPTSSNFERSNCCSSPSALASTTRSKPDNTTSLRAPPSEPILDKEVPLTVRPLTAVSFAPATVSRPPTPNAPPTEPSELARKVPTMSRVRSGVVVPRPRRPSVVRRIRSVPRSVVRKTMGLSEPTENVIEPAVLPEVAVVDSVKPSLTRVKSGVFTDDPALTVEAFSVVNVPTAAPPAPIVVLLMAPPPIATLLVWNWPPAVMVTRVALLVRKRRSFSSVVPMKFPAPIPALPERPQASDVTSVDRATCDS